MSNLTSKITDTYFPRKNSILQPLFQASSALPAGDLRRRSLHPNRRKLSLFYFGEFTDLVCAILYAAAIFTCILTGEGRPSSSKGDTSAEK